MRNSRIRREIAQKGLATCIKLNLESSRVVEMAGLAGFASVWICREHVPGEWTGIEEAVRAAKIHDVDVVVRVSKGSYSDYIKPFECDAAAIMVPHVTSAQEARNIVETCRFMPLGKRPLDGGCVDGGFTLLPVEEYLETSNREKLIILQIESPEAVEVIDEIAAVEGYDFLLFGPGDYAHRIGKAGQIHHPEVLEARRKVEEATLRHGKLGFSVGAQGTPRELRDRGYGVVNLSSDVRSLISAMQQSVSSFQNDAATSDAYYQQS